jgi:hypothetical protein
MTSDAGTSTRFPRRGERVAWVDFDGTRRTGVVRFTSGEDWYVEAGCEFRRFTSDQFQVGQVTVVGEAV